MIRRAKKQDAKRCVELLNLAMEDIAFTLSGVSDPTKSDDILCNFFQSEINRLSYNNVFVYEENGITIGAVCGYFGGDSALLDEPIVAHLKDSGVSKFPQPECEEDEFYIDSIAVDENFRGRGIATKLIDFICDQTDFKKIALIVDENKPETVAFYERLGFGRDGEKIINSHKYFHMVRDKR